MSISRKTKTVELKAGEMSEVGPEVKKEMVKDNLWKTIETNLKKWEGSKKALKEIS